MPKISEDYHDYIFKDGKCIGLFDDMYKYSKDTPWHQDKESTKWFNQSGILIVRDLVEQLGQSFEKILEVGCGLGYIINQFQPFGRKLYGCDVSQTVIEQAKEIHPAAEYFCCDLREPLKHRQKYNMVVMVDMMWYVTDYAQIVKKNVMELLEPGGYLLFKLSFPNLDENFVGKAIFTNPKKTLEFWSDAFQMLYSCEIEEYYTSLGPYMWFLAKKRE